MLYWTLSPISFGPTGTLLPRRSVLFIAGLSLRDLSERLCLTGASRESVRLRVHRFSSLFRLPEGWEELVTAIAAMHDIIRVGGEEVIPT
jgi:hypothetical protein